MRSSSHPLTFKGIIKQGIAAIVETCGNQDVRVILHGRTKSPNFAVGHVHEVANAIARVRPRQNPSTMIDRNCAHFLTRNISQMATHNGQPKVLDDICATCDDRNTTGVMIKSFSRREMYSHMGSQLPTYVLTGKRRSASGII
jgi:3-deoxy-7-phosphoheptulonate synthase